MTSMTRPVADISLARPVKSATKTQPRPVLGRRYRSLAWTPHKEAVLCAAIGVGSLVQTFGANTELAHLAHFDAAQVQNPSQ